MLMNKIPSIDSLHKEKSIKENSKAEIFNIVLSKCIQKITYTNRHTDQTFVIFEVPKILIGYPSYDMKLCMLFLINKLSQNGYYLAFIEPFYLYIDWGSAAQSKVGHFRAGLAGIPSANQEKLRQQTKDLLQKFPDTTKVEYVYEDMVAGNSSKQKKKNKKGK